MQTIKIASLPIRCIEISQSDILITMQFVNYCAVFPLYLRDTTAYEISSPAPFLLFDFNK